jgi:putative membrane protein
MMHWYGNGMMDSGDGVLGALITLIVIALAVVGVLALVRASRGGSLGLTRPSSEQLLDERFARGEIDIEEYTRRRDLLRAAHSVLQ